STIFVLTTGKGVYGFTLDPLVGEFILSHDNVKKQKHTRKTNLGIGRGPKSPEGTQAFTEELRAFWTLGDTTDTQTRSASVLLLLPDEEWPEPNYLGCHPQLHPDPHQSPALLAPGYPVDILTSHMH
ncbi:hypothetical protein MMC34_008681, partial [Xylographa carneopallida]|nr:hypothetical protein [Xylographa carneopallida]